MFSPFQWHLRVALRYEVLKQRMGPGSKCGAPHTIIGVGPPGVYVRQQVEPLFQRCEMTESLWRLMVCKVPP